MDVLIGGEDVPKTEFEEFEADVECWMHADGYYQRFAFSVDDRVYRIDRPHIESELESIADDLRP